MAGINRTSTVACLWRYAMDRNDERLQTPEVARLTGLSVATIQKLLCLAKTAFAAQVRRAAELGEACESRGRCRPTPPGHRNSVVNVEARRLVVMGPGSDAIEEPPERRGGCALTSGGAARVPVVKPAEAG